jgi:GT2 family glycosyltransferase
VKHAAGTIVYVDSGSSDGSVEWARGIGVDCVELDAARPFSAARGRTTGFERLRGAAPGVEYVYFVDGDCETSPDWMPTAVEFLDAHPRTAVVCGRRRERFPERSVYNRMCDVEWDAAVGVVASCGGDSVMRVTALEQVGSFDPSIVAGEEPELCFRLREAGWEIRRLAADMTSHDAAMTRFSQWWTRCVRGGFGGLDVLAKLRAKGLVGELPNAKMTRSARIWAVAWPAAVIVAAVAGHAAAGRRGAAAGACLVGVLGPLQALRIAAGRRKLGTPFRTALEYGFLTMAAKFPQLQGQIRWRLRRARGEDARIIEYKSAAH